MFQSAFIVLFMIYFITKQYSLKYFLCALLIKDDLYDNAYICIEKTATSKEKKSAFWIPVTQLRDFFFNTPFPIKLYHAYFKVFTSKTLPHSVSDCRNYEPVSWWLSFVAEYHIFLSFMVLYITQYVSFLDWIV